MRNFLDVRNFCLISPFVNNLRIIIRHALLCLYFMTQKILKHELGCVRKFPRRVKQSLIDQSKSRDSCSFYPDWSIKCYSTLTSEFSNVTTNSIYMSYIQSRLKSVRCLDTLYVAMMANLCANLHE